MNAPKIPSFFKTKKPNQFYFEPRYYNERKEKMQQRYDRIANELKQENSEKTNTETFRSSLRESWGASRRKPSGINYRIIFYIVILSGLAYYYLAN
ncbi:MAG: hypothetical protein KDD29_10535 [Flavobacteriales bacterium]|nr:hypothetical protein [Flavobacteriales bacterium]